MFLEWLRNRQDVFIPFGLLLVSIILLSLGSHREHRNTSLISKVVLNVIGAGQYTVTSSVDGTASLWDRYIWLRGVEEENRILKDELQTMRRKNHLLREQAIENDRLRRLLHFKPREDLEDFVPAEVIGYDPNDINETVTINKGSYHGVAPRSAVITYDSALVGQILDEPGSAIALTISKVLLITDRRSHIEVMSQRSRSRGMLSGRLEGRGCEFLLRDRLADVKEGDILVTTGAGGIFRKGWPVGVISEIRSDPATLDSRISVDPMADFSKLEEVIIITPKEEPD